MRIAATQWQSDDGEAVVPSLASYPALACRRGQSRGPRALIAEVRKLHRHLELCAAHQCDRFL